MPLNMFLSCSIHWQNLQLHSFHNIYGRYRMVTWDPSELPFFTSTTLSIQVNYTTHTISHPYFKHPFPLHVMLQCLDSILFAFKSFPIIGYTSFFNLLDIALLWCILLLCTPSYTPIGWWLACPLIARLKASHILFSKMWHFGKILKCDQLEARNFSQPSIGELHKTFFLNS